MNLGAFSVSLSVKDLKKSRAFYEALGFEYLGGEADQGWLILKNRSHVIGLFQGMFQGNLLTFNPGWNQNAQEENPFTDIRNLARDCREKGLSVQDENTPGDSGPGSFTLTDPDGNVILVDQHR